MSTSYNEMKDPNLESKLTEYHTGLPILAAIGFLVTIVRTMRNKSRYP